jgi:hypothetical protein
MRRKADRFAGRNLRNYKQRGEWAELYFMMMVAGQGMRVSKPLGEFGKYDVGVENQNKVLRVQVKSAAYTERKNEYCFNLMGPDPERPKYPPGSIDFFAILLIPSDDWYIVPFDLVLLTTRSLHFCPGSRREKHAEYWEAWHLLQQAGLEIQACADDDWPDERKESRFLALLGMTNLFARLTKSWSGASGRRCIF